MALTKAGKSAYNKGFEQGILAAKLEIRKYWLKKINSIPVHNEDGDICYDTKELNKMLEYSKELCSAVESVKV